MPSGRSPAFSSASSSEETMSRRAATTTTSTRRSPPSEVVWPTTCQSSTAWSRGIGMCSCAWKRIAVSSSVPSSSAGRKRVRTTTRWLATPSLTVFESLLRANRSLSASASASGSVTSPSRKTPGSSSAIPCRSTRTEPFALTSLAAMLPASMSRPTRVFCLLVENICAVARRRRRSRRRSAFARLSLSPGRLHYPWRKNSSRYQSTISSPHQSPITPPRARKGPNGIACLRASAP